MLHKWSGVAKISLIFSKTLNKKIINVNSKQQYYWLLVFFLRLGLIIGIISAIRCSLF